MKVIRVRFHKAVPMGTTAIPHEYLVTPYGKDYTGTLIDDKPVDLTLDWVGGSCGLVIRWGHKMTEFVPMNNIAGITVLDYEAPVSSVDYVNCHVPVSPSLQTVSDIVYAPYVQVDEVNASEVSGLSAESYKTYGSAEPEPPKRRRGRPRKTPAA